MHRNGFTWAIALLCSYVFLCPLAYGQDYITITSGNWNDGAIWSTDGGNSSCNCSPNREFDDHLVINHDVTASGDDIKVEDGGMLEINHATLNAIDVGILVEEGGEVQTNLAFFIIQNGNLDIKGGAFANFTQTSFSILGDGNVNVEGVANYIGPACIELDHGNYNVSGSGEANGSAGLMLHDDGNLQNDGIFSTGIEYCLEDGTSSGVHAINCEMAQQYCLSTYNVLPLRWLSFTAERHLNGILLNWETIEEEILTGFSIERIRPGEIDFIEIGEVKSLGGFTTVNTYSWIDEEPVVKEGIFYYRITSITEEGKRYSSEIGLAVRLCG